MHNCKNKILEIKKVSCTVGGFGGGGQNDRREVRCKWLIITVIEHTFPNVIVLLPFRVYNCKLPPRQKQLHKKKKTHIITNATMWISIYGSTALCWALAAVSVS
jgi:hypothetical protein